MNNLPPPGTAWREKIAADEQQRYEGYSALFTRLQARKSQRWGTGRALHRKPLAAAHGSLEVLDGLPAWAKQGLFAHPGDHEVWVRTSNGGFDVAADRKPDIRGFAFKVFGVEGESALGGPCKSQDFTLINQESFGFESSREFVGFVDAVTRGGGALLRYMVKTYGLLGGPKRLASMIARMGRPFTGFATEKFYSAVPMACGPYAARVRLVPAPTNGEPLRGASADWGADFAARLAQGPLHWDLQLQYFADESVTPIEDASVNWTTPYVTVARLMLPRQDVRGEEGARLASRIESAVIDPWQALAEHRPLGDVQRARKAVYFASQKARGAG